MERNLQNTRHKELEGRLHVSAFAAWSLWNRGIIEKYNLCVIAPICSAQS